MSTLVRKSRFVYKIVADLSALDADETQSENKIQKDG
jgi:hypothetical protein